jgi:hypothetical protein
MIAAPENCAFHPIIAYPDEPKFERFLILSPLSRNIDLVGSPHKAKIYGIY